MENALECLKSSIPRGKMCWKQILGFGDVLACLVDLSQFSYGVEAYELMNTLLRVSEEEKGLSRL